MTFISTTLINPTGSGLIADTELEYLITQVPVLCARKLPAINIMSCDTSRVDAHACVAIVCIVQTLECCALD